MRLAVVILAVDDLARSVAFYDRAFSLEKRVEAPVYVEYAFPSGSGFGVYERQAFGANTGRVPPPVAPGQLGGAEVYFHVDDLTGAIEGLEAAGARPLSARAVRGWGDEAAYFADPDGHVVVVARATDPVVRPACNGDLEAIRDVVYGVLTEYGLAPEPGATDADLADIEAAYFERGGFFEVVLDADGRVAGTVGLHPIDGQTCELRKMYLLPRLRGRGFGRKILESTIDRARALGFRVIELETAAVLEEAIALYSARGFRKLDRRPGSGRCDQVHALELDDPQSKP